MRKFLAIVLIVALAFGALFGLPLLIGVWLPDVITASQHTIAERQLGSGHTFRVVQYWNRSDFYSTELHVTWPDGRKKVYTLDGDDAKSWRLPLTVDEDNQTATVILGGGRVKNVDWK